MNNLAIAFEIMGKAWRASLWQLSLSCSLLWLWGRSPGARRTSKPLRGDAFMHDKTHKERALQARSFLHGKIRDLVYNILYAEEDG